MFNSRLDQLLAGATASGLLILGIGETIARLDEPMPLFFWFPTLSGGAAMVFAGGFLVRGNPRLAKVFVLVGCVAGFTPSAWTLVMPAFLVALAIRRISVPRPAPELHSES